MCPNSKILYTVSAQCITYNAPQHQMPVPLHVHRSAWRHSKTTVAVFDFCAHAAQRPLVLCRYIYCGSVRYICRLYFFSITVTVPFVFQAWVGECLPCTNLTCILLILAKFDMPTLITVNTLNTATRCWTCVSSASDTYFNSLQYNVPGQPHCIFLNDVYLVKIKHTGRNP